MQAEVLASLTKDLLAKPVALSGPLRHASAEGGDGGLLEVGVREGQEVALDVGDLEVLLHGRLDKIDGVSGLARPHEVIQALEDSLNGGDGDGVACKDRVKSER